MLDAGLFTGMKLYMSYVLKLIAELTQGNG